MRWVSRVSTRFGRLRWPARAGILHESFDSTEVILRVAELGVFMNRNRTAFLAAFFTTALFAASVAAQTEADLQGANPPANGLWVDSLDLSRVEQDWGEPHAGRSVDNRPITLHGDVYRHGVGTHANSEMLIDLKGAAVRFAAVVGVDDEKKGLGSVRFHVFVDGKPAAETGVLHGGDAPKLLSVDLTGAKMLRLQVDDADDGIDSDHADWAGAVLRPQPRRQGQAADRRAAQGADARRRPRRRAEAGDSLPPHRRRHAGPAVPLSHPGHRRRAARLHGREPARRPDPRRKDRRPLRVAQGGRQDGRENHREGAGRRRLGRRSPSSAASTSSP